MDRQWHIRRATTDDATGMALCLDAAYADHAARIPDLPDMASGCAAEIADNQVWIASQKDAVVGVLVLNPATHFMKLANVAVHPTLRGRGLGKDLMTLAETEAKRQGFARMQLNTHAAMPDNIELYQRLGWERSDQKGTVVTMEKPLSSSSV